MALERVSGPPPVVCVVLNWNGWRDTLRCLETLSRCEYRGLRVVVVDNRSTDDSVVRIRAAFPDLPLIEAGENRGFGAGNNLGIGWGLEQGAEYLWLLNNDAAPSAEALGAMVARAEGDPEVGAVGSVLHYMDRPGTVQAWGGGRVNRWTGFTRHAMASQPDEWFDYLTAASMLVRAEALRGVGPFDERFFLYWEDTDLGLRLRRAGWRLAVSAQALVLHAEGASTGKNFRLVDRLSTSSGLLFLELHAPVPWIAQAVFLSLRLLKRAMRGQWQRVGAVWQGFGEFRRRPRVSRGGGLP